MYPYILKLFHRNFANHRVLVVWWFITSLFNPDSIDG
jgi:hypothetical protein